MKHGQLVLICGPSGSGKTTLSEMFRDAGAYEVISTTTRQPRAGEEDGVHYHFTTPEQFDAIAKTGGFLEHATFGKNRYGMQSDSVLSIMEAGRTAVAVVEIQGIQSVRDVLEKCRDSDMIDDRLKNISVTYVFMNVDAAIAEERLRARDVGVNQETMDWRVSNIPKELENIHFFQNREDSVILCNPDIPDMQEFTQSVMHEKTKPEVTPNP